MNKTDNKSALFVITYVLNTILFKNRIYPQEYAQHGSVKELQYGGIEYHLNTDKSQFGIGTEPRMK